MGRAQSHEQDYGHCCVHGVMSFFSAKNLTNSASDFLYPHYLRESDYDLCKNEAN